MTHKEALIQVLRIIETVPPLSMGPRNEAIWNVIEELNDEDVTFDVQPPTA